MIRARDCVTRRPAFSTGASSAQTHRWTNYTGCDSLNSIAADSSAVYVGGHHRWLDNDTPKIRPHARQGDHHVGTFAAAGRGSGSRPSDQPVHGWRRPVARSGVKRRIRASCCRRVAATTPRGSARASGELGCDSYRYPLDTFVVQSPGMGGLSPSTGATAYGHLGLCLLPY